MYYSFKYTKETVKVFVNQRLIDLLIVTFWHETCLNGITQINFIIMKRACNKLYYLRINL
jgi:hypothetical protein